jgi:hypothetical protein
MGRVRARHRDAGAHRPASAYRIQLRHERPVPSLLQLMCQITNPSIRW